MPELLRKVLRRIPFANMETGRILSCIQLLIALTFLLAVATVCFTMVRHSRSNAATELVSRGATVSSIIARAAARALQNPEKSEAEIALDKILYDIRAEEGLEFVFLVDQNYRAIAHSNHLKKGKLLPMGLPGRANGEAPKQWVDDGLYYVSYPGTESTVTNTNATIHEFVRTLNLAPQAQEKWGNAVELHMGFSLPGLWPFVLTSLKRALPALAIAFLLLILGNYLAGVFVRPISTLKAETAQAARAEDDWQLDVEARGEVGDIVENWNKMVETFQVSYQRVIDARREMEVRNRVMLYEKKRTEAIVDSLSDSVMVTDAYGKISFINRECENLLGLDREAAVSRSPEDTIEFDSVAKFVKASLVTSNSAFGSRADHGKRAQKRAADLEIAKPTGSRHLKATYVPVLDTNGKPGGAILTLRDVTQAKLEENARKDFISSVTHELRAPLTAIKSYVEMLIDDEAKDPELQRDFFNTINEEADRLARLINDMLNMSKIEVGNLVLNKSIVRTRKMVEDAVNGMRSAAKTKEIELTWDIADDLPDVEADKEMVRVVVTNLLGNGIKYTQDGGKVFLSAEHIDDPATPGGTGFITVTVADNGPGIPDDEQNKIFEKFYRGKSTADQKVVGNGLGLALAREIATLHGGDIKLTSAVGEGSKFTFMLPAVETSRKVS